MAIYYWVGGTGTWSGTGNTQFAITSGGVATVLNPTAADTVNFDTNSGAAATVTVTATAVSLNTTVNKADINLSLSGSPTLCTAVGTLTFTTGTITLNTYALSTGILSSNNSNTRAIAFGTGSINITGNSTTVLQVTTATGFTYTGTPTINFTYSGSTGTRNLRFGNGGGFTETNSPHINITAGSDIVDFAGGSKNLNFTGFSGTYSNNTKSIYGNFTIPVGVTPSAGTLVTTFAATSGTKTITTNNVTQDYPLTFNGIGGTFAFQDALTQGSTRAFMITNGTVQLKDGTTNTIGAFATSGANQKVLQSTTSGTQATLSQASGTVTTTYLTIQDSIATGGATWDATSRTNTNYGNNTGWLFTAPSTLYSSLSTKFGFGF